MKNKFWSFILALLIIAPSVVAVANYFYSKDAPVSLSSVTSVTLTDLYNEEYSFEKTSGELDLTDIGSNMVQFFTDVNSSAKSEPELPEPLQGTKYYKVKLNDNLKTVEYKYYFSKQPEYCYYLDENEKCFSISRDYAAAFLTSVYGRSVFDDATLPIMTTPAGEIITPSNIKWTYLAVDDKTPTYTETNKTDDTVYNIAEQISVGFSIPASSVNITVSDATGELYNGLYEKIAFTNNIPTGAELTVKIDAKWYQTEERKGEGEATYTFKCRVTDKPVFSLNQNSDTVISGDFVNILGKNIINDPADIVVTCLPDIKVKPVFYTDNYYVKALLPIPLGTPAGTYTLKILADGTEHNLEFTVTEKNYSTKYEAISSDLLNDESIAAFDEAMKDVLTAKSGERYFEGGFIYPTSGGVVASGFGRPTQTEGGYKYLNNFVRLLIASGSDVKAMNAGKVVYVGEQTITGKTVVVDHGLGLMSIYGNMTSTSVNEGDVVATGDVLGKSGNTGYTDGSLVSVTLAINGTYVCPYEIWDDDGIVFDGE